MSDFSRDEIHEAFKAVVNTVEPEHPYHDDPYPIDMTDMETSYCRSDGRFLAKCGPRGTISTVVSFAIDLSWANRASTDELAATLVHEATHITEGGHSEGSTHNPTFWREMATNAALLAKDPSKLEAVIGEIDREAFFDACENDPNASMTDRRMRTVEEQQQEVRETIEAEYGTPSPIDVANAEKTPDGDVVLSEFSAD